MSRVILLEVLTFNLAGFTGCQQPHNDLCIGLSAEYFSDLFSIEFTVNAARMRYTMFSHVVIFWTHQDNPSAAEELINGANTYLKPIPGVLSFHIGKMVPSHRQVVDKTYQVALNIVFPSKQAQDDYQTHPSHIEFVEKVFKRVCKGVIVYDFE